MKEESRKMKNRLLQDNCSSSLAILRTITKECLVICCAFCLIVSISGCIKHEVELKDRKIAIHYNDRFYDVAVVNEHNIWIVGFYGKSIYSSDGGSTWAIQKTGMKDPLTGVEFINATEGWIVSLDGTVLHTVTGGKDWSRQDTHTECAFLDIEFCGETKGFIVGGNNTIVRTENRGKDWIRCEVPEEMFEDESGGFVETSETILNAVHCIDEDTVWVVGEYGMVYATTDGGATWEKKNVGISSGDYLFDVGFIDEQKGFIAGIGGRLFTTSDGGKQWSSHETPTENALYAVAEADGAIWIAGNRGMLMKYGTELEAYSGVLPALSWFRTIKFIDDQTGWIVGGSGIVLKTVDKGEQWVVIN